ncbi:tyrosine-type recombinase/integrase [Jeotgalibacillus malaysiensis]|uniref:site-specific integrase n=1 Tax=Jeotgalibacillus malaysiensis TaxID=1508404 RepID=UPI00384EF9A9
MGTVYKRGKTWSYQFYHGIDPETGKPIRHYEGGFDKRKTALDAMDEAILDIKKGLAWDSKSVKFGELAENWIEGYIKMNAKPGSVRIRRNEMGHLLKAFRYSKVKDITRIDLQNLVDNLLAREYARSTVSGIMTCARMIFKAAQRDGLILKNPVDHVIIPKEILTVEKIESEEGDVMFLEKDELTVFLDTAREKGLDKDYAIFSFIAYTGLRLGETIALKWDDLDFENNTVKVTKQIYNPTNNQHKYKILTPKTRHSIRTLEVDESIMQLLKKHKLFQYEQKFLIGQDYHDLNFVFARANGLPEVPKQINNRIARLMRLSGIEKKVSTHGLRHTHTSLLVEAGHDLIMIRDRLGHKDLETTVTIYTHITKSLKVKASHQFSESMKGFTERIIKF